jgi:glucose-6-phosphate isomerase
VEIREQLRYFSSKSNKGKSTPLKNKTFRGITLDLSRNFVSNDTFIKMKSLLTMNKFSEKRKKLFSNKLISKTESQQVSFIYYRNSRMYDKAIEKMSKFYLKIKQNKIKSSDGNKIDTIVHIGIGGSILGPKFLSEAFESYRKNDFVTYFVSSGDTDEIADLIKKIDVKRTLFIFVSKSFKTDETMRVKLFIDNYLEKNFPDHADYIYKNQFIAISSNKLLCKSLNFLSKNIFTFPKTIPGRFSIASPVTMINMFEIGIQNYIKFVNGIRSMDSHFLKAKFESNLPINLALINVWNINYLSKHGNVIVPYSYRLRNISNYIQQIEMESNGKSITNNSEYTPNMTAPLVFGTSGTECQHSFFQAAHQGTLHVYFDFIYVRQPNTNSNRFLAANVHAQADLLFRGKKKKYSYKSLNGNSPSNLVSLDRISPDRIGKVISLYEHKVFIEGVIWNINSYDQWGVEEGKTLAKKNLLKS